MYLPILLLFECYCTTWTDTDAGFASFTQVCLIRVCFTVYHLKDSNRTVVHAFFTAFTFVFIHSNYERAQTFSPPYMYYRIGFFL